MTSQSIQKQNEITLTTLNKYLTDEGQPTLCSKMSKCDIFKSQIHYLGHLLSQDGISSLQGKLDAIRTMPPSQNIKELRQFLGLTGYYRNHINHYADITNSLTKLLKKDEPYIWTEIHINSFSELKTCLQSPPILIHPDLHKPYFLFTDVSKNCWGATLCQHTSDSDPDNLQDLKPTTFISGKFSKKQCNYAALVREAFNIYIYIYQKTASSYKMQNVPSIVITNPMKNFHKIKYKTAK